MLDSVSSPITKRVYNLGLDEFFAWYSQEPRPGFTKATVAAWRVALEARGLGAVSINVRITAVRKLAVEAADNGLLAPELANGITRVKGVASKGVRLGNWLTAKQARHYAPWVQARQEADLERVWRKDPLVQADMLHRDTVIPDTSVRMVATYPRHQKDEVAN